MRRNAAVVGGEAVFGVLLKLLLPFGKVPGRAFGGKIFSAGIFPVDILPKSVHIIFEVSFPSDCWVIGTLHYRKTCLTSFFVQMQDAIISYCILYCVLDITFRVCQINKNRCPKQWKYTLNTHNETNLICQRAENPCISSIL